MLEMQPVFFPKNIKNDCCLVIADDIDTKLWWERFKFCLCGLCQRVKASYKVNKNRNFIKEQFDEAGVKPSLLPSSCTNWSGQLPL